MRDSQRDFLTEQRDSLFRAAGKNRPWAGTPMNQELAESTKLTPIGCYWTYLEAWIARNLLTDNGIQAFVNNERLVTADWTFANAIGGITIDVLAEQSALAREILATPPEVPAEIYEVQPDDGGDACRECQSRNTYGEWFHRRVVFLAWLVLGFPWLVESKAIVCFDCGARTGPPLAFGRIQFTLRDILLVITILAVMLAIVSQLDAETLARLWQFLRAHPSLQPVSGAD